MPQLSVLIKPASSMCNLRCRYCFYADESKHRNTESYGKMTSSTLENLVRKAFAYADGQISFAFQGGEPTLAGKDFFREYLALVKKYNSRGIQVNNAIQTNGICIDAEWCAVFREGNFLVGLSLDGTKDLHDSVRRTYDEKGTFEAVSRTAELLDDEHIEFNILCVITESASKHPTDIFRNLKKYRFLQFIPCLDDMDFNSPFSVSAESYGSFLISAYEQYEKSIYCKEPLSIRNFDNWIGMIAGYPPENCALSGKCGNYYLIEADGTVFPCDFYALDKWRLGNINSDSFFRLAKNEVGKSFISESLNLPEACRKCKWLSLCRGGCKRDREPIINGIPSENRLCQGHRMFFEEKYKDMVKLAKFMKGEMDK